MEKLYITEEIAGHEANKHLNLKVGEEVEVGDGSAGCPKADQAQPPGPGRWVETGGNCVWEPA